MQDAPTPPTPPDPVATATAQAQANAGTAAAQTALNNTNQITPYGTMTYDRTGSYTYTNPDGSTSTVPTYTSTQTLSPGQQALYDQQVGLGQQSNTAASTALGTLQGSLANPVTENSLPGLQTSVGTGPDLYEDYDLGGQVRDGYDPGGALQSSYAGGGPIQNSYASGGNILRGYDQGGAIQGDVALDNHASTTFGATRNGVQDFNPGDFSAARDGATSAVLQRLAPTMAAQDEAQNAQLASQGLVQGSAAWNAAKLSQSQANNDLRLGAVATGDAEQQALFGQAATTNQLRNAAQQQDYAQQQGRGLFALGATKQNNDATLDMGTFHNAAQLQQNQENANAAAFANKAQDQAEGQSAARAAFSNSAQMQGEQESAARAAFSNATQTTQNAENQQAAAFSNSAQAQRTSQNQQLTSFDNAAQQQAYENWIQGNTFANQAREQGLTDQETINNNAVNQISALMHGGQVSNGQYQGYTPGQIGTTPISQDTYASASLAEQGYQTQAQADAQNNAAMFSALGGLFGLGGKMMGGGMFSDRRLKRDVFRIGAAASGLPVYRFRYLDGEDTHVGHMADEVARVRPDAVHRHPSGFDMVDYSALEA